MAKTLLLTRARLQAHEFSMLVEQKTKFQCHIAPMQEMRDLPVELSFDGVDGLVFTSKNGVESFARRWDVRNIPAYCVGPATAAKAEDAGMRAFSASGNSEALAGLINRAKLKNPLHIHGLHMAGDMEIGGSDLAIYEQVALPLDQMTVDMLAIGEIDAIALFSPRSAQLLADVWQAGWPETVFFCISEATGKPVEKLGQTMISGEPSADSMLARLLN